MYKNWLFKKEGHVATLTLDRLEKKNTLDPDTVLELREITRSIKEQHDIWAVVVRSQGKHFSVGMDVNGFGSLVGLSKQAFHDSLHNLQSCVDEFEQLEKPTIAQINGYCLGGGLILALCCDFRVADETAVLGLPEVKRSLAVIMGTQRITRIAGVSATKELVMLGDNVNAKRALRLGLLNRVVAEGELETAVSTLTSKLCQLPPRAVGISKRVIDRGHSLSLRDSQDLEIEAQSELLDSPDFQEAIFSFLEKRTPNYTGK